MFAPGLKYYAIHEKHYIFKVFIWKSCIYKKNLGRKGQVEIFE